MRKPIVVALEVAFVVALTGCFLSAAAAGPIYHYVTDDGTYAFTDQKKKVPARYQDAVQVKQRRSLHGYKRYTPAETPQLASPRPAAPEAAPTFAGAGAGAQSGISIRTGGAQSPTIDITPGAGEPPIVIEKKRFVADGTAVTRTYTIVRQGDRILTVIKPQPHQTNVTEFGDEDDFEIE